MFIITIYILKVTIKKFHVMSKIELRFWVKMNKDFISIKLKTIVFFYLVLSDKVIEIKNL